MLFLVFPSDVILEISLRLDLGDAIALLSTCTLLRQLLEEKSFWLHALDRVRRIQMHPIAVPIRQELSDLSLAQLQEAGKRTNRLMKNWLGESPKSESVREMFLDAVDRTKIIVISGTGLVISHGPGLVSCWDIFTRLRVGRLVVDRALSIESATFEEYGQVLLGLSDQDGPGLHVAAISVNYLDRTAVSISVIVTHTFSRYPGSSKYSRVSVDHSTVRVIPTSSEPYRYHLLSVSFTGNERIIEDIIPGRDAAHWESPSVATIPHPAGVYFMRHAGHYAALADLPTGTVKATPSIHIVELQRPNKSLEIWGHPVADPITDVVLIVESPSAIEFWAARRDDRQVIFSVSSCNVTNSGSTIAIGASGMYALLSNTIPLLLRHVPGGSPLFKHLMVPVEAMYGTKRQLALDDHIGIIILVQADGTLRIVSYA
ncbi:hypothetical protein C8R47DRAFT_1086214 [Mycena vitilis]|nr:hypothetical protein C8R47DRAFT_1086214 [Mycena vitilis]